LLSESQERMLLVAKPEHEEDVRQVLERWDLQAATIGQVTDDGFFRVREDGEIVCEIPVLPLVDDCPTYVRDGVESPEAVAARETDLEPYRSFEDDDAVSGAVMTLLDAPTIGSRRWIHEQYDTTVQTNTLEGPGSDAAVLRLPGGDRALAASTDGNGRYTYLGARTGGRIAVAESARNVACSGARPVAVTNCLNFGSPLRPSVYFQLSEAVAGMGEACRALGTPVTGGNVSLYNETGGSPVYPTPVIGMLGLIEHRDRRVPSHFQEVGDEVLVVGTTREEIGASEYLAACHGLVAGAPPDLDLDEAVRLVDFLVAAADAGLMRSAHDCSDGGLAVALAECAILADDGSTGLTVNLDLATTEGEVSTAALWFGESQSRVVVSCDSGRREELFGLAAEHAVPIESVGEVGDRSGDWSVSGGGHTVVAAIADLRRTFDNALPRRMREQAGLTS
ncbi:MAG: AIR synthase related protein, partial [Gemmatimonadota bacterium]|nr:AIR synthase related protein [Gemmatimonadota bacterium]